MTRRRQRGEGGLFQRASDGLWVGRIELGWRNGRRQRKTVYGRTMAEAQAKMRAARVQVEAGVMQTAGTTLESWLDLWLTDIVPGKRKMSPNTLRSYESYARNYLVPCLGKVRLDRLAARHVRDLHSYVMTTKGLSATTASHAHAILSTALRDAMREGLITSNPAELVDHPQTSKSNVRRALTLDEVRRLFEVLADPAWSRTATRWLVAVMLGMRQGECLGLQWDRIDFDAGTIAVDTQLQRVPWAHGCPTVLGRCGTKPEHCRKRRLRTLPGYDYEVVKGNLCLVRAKTESSRRLIPVPPLLLGSLRQFWQNSNPTSRLVWTGSGGWPIEPTEDRREWHTLLALAEIEDTDEHSARHTASTLLLALGVSDDVRQAILGHSTAAARRIYSHVDIELARSAMLQLESGVTNTDAH